MRATRQIVARITTLVASLSLTSVSLYAQGNDPQPLTGEQLNKLDRAEAYNLPALRVLPIGKGISDQVFYGMVETALLDLRYLIAPPTGKPSPQLTEAIKLFQRDIGHKETGSLLFGEWDELGRRARRLEPIPIYLGSASVIAFGDLAKVEGTWVFDSDDPVYTQAYPIQTTTIECNRRTGTCTDATAVIGYEADSAILSVYLDIWRITKWSDSEIVAENDQAECMSYTLSINLPTKKVSAFRRGKGTAGCEAFSTSPQITRLVDGLDVSQHFFQQRDQEANQLRNPRFTSVLGGILNP